MKNNLKRKISFYFMMIALIYFMIECFSFITYSIVEKRLFSFSRIFSEQINRFQEIANRIIVPETKERITEPMSVLHPYLGFVYNPELNTEKFIKSHRCPISEYGFIDCMNPIHVKSNDKITMGIFGGSFAYWFSVHGIDALTKELKNSTIFFDKEIIVVRVALGGYKQPQQLIALNYLLVLGAHFDIIINIDGFNEVVLPAVENIPKNVFAFYPRNWFMMTQGLVNPDIQTLLSEIIYLKKKRIIWVEFFSKVPLRYSITLNLIWKNLDRTLAMALSKCELALLNYRPKANNYITAGPPCHHKKESDLYTDLASVWKMSSIQMHRLCTANNIKYFHFLQPNQYVPGAKIMREEELKQAFLNDHPYRLAVEKGYPYLIKAGNELVKQGINFHDLTMVFVDNEDPLYIDTCCHLNEKGDNILGTIIGKTIIQDISYSKKHEQ